MVVEWRVAEAAEWSGLEKKEKDKGKNSDIIAVSCPWGRCASYANKKVLS